MSVFKRFSGRTLRNAFGKNGKQLDCVFVTRDLPCTKPCAEVLAPASRLQGMALTQQSRPTESYRSAKQIHTNKQCKSNTMLAVCCTQLSELECSCRFKSSLPCPRTTWMLEMLVLTRATRRWVFNSRPVSQFTQSHVWTQSLPKVSCRR